MSESQLWSKDGFTISTDMRFIDREVVFRYLNEESYWANGIPREIVEKSIENSLCFGVYKGNPSIEQSEQVGFARVITDLATFAYLADVFILSAYRGNGVSKWLMSRIIEHPDLQMVRRFLLITRDAHGLYAQYGFNPVDDASLMMQIHHQMLYENKM